VFPWKIWCYTHFVTAAPNSRSAPITFLYRITAAYESTSLPYQTVKRCSTNRQIRPGECDHRVNSGSDAAKRVVFNGKETEMFAKPRLTTIRGPRKRPLPLRASVSSKKAKKPRRKKIVKKKKSKS
jgi:hypothetical protein